MKFRSNYIIIILSVFLFSCSTVINENKDEVHIDFSVSDSLNINHTIEDSIIELNVAVAAITSPRQSFTYYQELFDYISAKLNYKIVFKQRKTYQEINDMLFKRQIDVAFVCSARLC